MQRKITETKVPAVSEETAGVSLCVPVCCEGTFIKKEELLFAMISEGVRVNEISADESN